MSLSDPLGAIDRLQAGGGAVTFWRLDRVVDPATIATLPFVVRVFLENVLRHQGAGAERMHLDALAGWPGDEPVEFPFLPARVVLQDFTGVPVVADLAAIRAAVKRLGGDVSKVNPRVPVDLVIDHSVIVDFFGSRDALERNVDIEYERNKERYAFLRWAQRSFGRSRVVPPGAGIVHQVNLEFLASVVMTDMVGDERIAYPDTLVGTDSHTTMIGGLGVLGWGVGGIEAEAAMLGEPVTMLTPAVVGVRLDGEMPEGATATDLVLTLTEMLRKHGVVGKFVEYYGPGLATLSVADRATIANMSPEYGATEGFFPVDEQTVAYLRATGRSDDLCDLVERYCKEQHLWHEHGAAPVFGESLTLDLSSVEPSLAGPKRPQDRVTLPAVKPTFRKELAALRDGDETIRTTPAASDGSVVIAAITSCTNTSNPAVMIAAGLVARNAVARGLSVSPTVKTSLAPGSPVVLDYLTRAGLIEPLEKAGFYTVGFGCTTCIASGTPVLHAEGIARPIEQLPSNGTKIVGPTHDGGFGVATHSALIEQGTRECVTLTLQDGRTLVCTPDHEILRADGSWVRADELRAGTDRVVAGPEAPVDEPADDEAGYSLNAGSMTFTMDAPDERAKTLAFARLLGHLLDDGSISVAGQGRINVGQAIDREAALDDIERVTGKRPAGTRYDERKWSIVLPKELTDAIIALPGVRTGRRIHQAPALPEFVLEPSCPVSVVREFLAGAFGADGTGPVLKRLGDREESAILEQPAYSHAVKEEHVDAQKTVMRQIVDLLNKCSVRTEGARVHTYPGRPSASSHPPAIDGAPRVEVRLELPDGLSFVTKVGFRYAVDKSLRASAAAVYWRTLESIGRQRLWMADRLRELHLEQPELSFSAARKLAAKELASREAIVFRHYSTLEGHDRFDRLPMRGARQFRPLHRDSCGFPSPVEVLREIGARDWFAPLRPRHEADFSKRYCVDKDSPALPQLTLKVVDIAAAGPREVYDLSVPGLHAFVAQGIAVHNCIGNSGPLPDEVATAVDSESLAVSAVLSGNRNFEGRVHPQVRFAFLASPPLVVAYALAGTVDVDLASEPLGTGSDGNPVYLRDIWPSNKEIADTVASSMDPESYRSRTTSLFEGDERWRSLPVPEGDLYEWDPTSTYITEPPFVTDVTMEPPAVTDIVGARVLVMVGDSITTDHISPAGSIAKTSPAADWLRERGVPDGKLHSYGARRGHHEVMMRGTFANIRLRNQLVPGSEGGVTAHLPDGETMSIFDASVRYREQGVPLIILAGKEYGSGSSRDWAAKGTVLLGARAVIAESFERIHRSNLAQMGALPLEFAPGESAASLGLTGRERYDITGLDSLKPGQTLRVIATADDGTVREFDTRCRLDTPTEVRYFRQGGILPAVVRELAR